MTIAIIELVDMDYIVVAEGSAALASAAIQAENAADRAEAAADTAVIAAAAVGAYPTVLDGENATDPGQSFFVYSGGAVTLYVNNAGVGEPVAPLATASDIAARPTYAELAADEGAALVGDKAPRSAAIVRTLGDRAHESRSVLEWFTAAQRAAARAGDLSIDMTAAIQSAADSGVPVIDMHDYASRVDGQIVIPSTGIRVTGDGWSIERGVGVVNNSDALFIGSNITGPVKLSKGKLIGNTVYQGPGWDPFAAAISVITAAEVEYDGMEASGFSSGFYANYVDKVTIHNGCFLHDNHLTGLGLIANDVIIENSRITDNGVAGTSGLTHALYIMNSSDGVIRNNIIGNNKDSISDDVTLRWDGPTSIPGFNTMKNWDIHSNKIYANGVRVASDNGEAVADRKPPENVQVFGNTFYDGASIRFEDPQNCGSYNNIGVNELIVNVASTYPGFAPYFTSENDDVKVVRPVSIFGIRVGVRDNLVFKNTTINNGADEAFATLAGYGGVPVGVIIEPKILGTGAPFDSAALGRFTNGDITVKSTGSMRYLYREPAPYIDIAAAGTYIPDNHTASEQVLIGRFVGSTATIGPPTVAVEGMSLDMVLRQQYASGAVTFTFDSSYKLTSATAAVVNTNVINQYLYLKFKYLGGQWRQMGDASWSAA